jgi:chromosome segregation ATPase
VVKQDDVTRLNQEGVRLVSDLSHTQKALHEERARICRLEQRLETVSAMEQRCNTLEAQLVDKESNLKVLQAERAEARKEAAATNQEMRRLERELAAAHARLEVQQASAMELRAFITAHKIEPGGAP